MADTVLVSATRKKQLSPVVFAGFFRTPFYIGSLKSCFSCGVSAIQFILVYHFSGWLIFSDPIYHCNLHIVFYTVYISLSFYFQFTTRFYFELCYMLSVDGGWGAWSEWSPCVKTCDGEEVFRTRVCDNPPPARGGKGCQGAARATKMDCTEPCQSKC